MFNALKASRLMAGLSQSDMARIVGVSQTKVFTLERGSSEITLDQLKRWFDAVDDYGKDMLRDYLRRHFF